MVRNILTEKQKNFSAYTHSNGNKEVYYLSMEFLMGRSLKNSLYNLEIVGLAVSYTHLQRPAAHGCLVGVRSKTNPGSTAPEDSPRSPEVKKMPGAAYPACLLYTSRCV